MTSTEAFWIELKPAGKWLKNNVPLMEQWTTLLQQKGKETVLKFMMNYAANLLESKIILPPPPVHRYDSDADKLLSKQDKTELLEILDQQLETSSLNEEQKDAVRKCLGRVLEAEVEYGELAIACEDDDTFVG